MFDLEEKLAVKEEFEENLLKAMNSMYNLALRLTRNTADAADLVQDASLRGFRFYHQYTQGTNFKGWILTIVRNLFINSYRKKVKEPAKIDYDEFEGVIGSTALSGMQEEVFGESVQVSMDKLPEELRTVLTLFYVEGFSYREIANIMKCPQGTVMSRLHTAKKALKKSLTLISTAEGRGEL
ncbi:MAG: RNA polymerase sigma-70 factor (ECF subfamily) [Lysobacterales bacterium]|jgi:RNA polymerase sigma-70 factor (ECF subfamily)